MFKKTLLLAAAGAMLAASAATQAEELVMGTESTYPPFEYVDTKNCLLYTSPSPRD